MPFTAHPFDVYAWYMYCMGVLRHGFDFSVLKSVNPLWLLTLTLIAPVYGFLSSATGWEATAVDAFPASFNPHYGITLVPGPLFNTLVKIPMVLADVGTALVLYRLVRRFSGTGLAEKAVTLFFLNPVSIWISSGWGQNDPIPAFLTVLSLFLLLNKKIIPSAVSLLLATLFKVYPAAFIVPASVYLFKKGTRRALFKYLLVFLASYSVFLISGGMKTVDNLFRLVLGFFFPRGAFHGIFGFGLTYWSWSMVFPLDPGVWTPVSALLMAVLFGISLYFVSKTRFDDPLKGLAMATFLVSAAFFLSSRFVSEARFVWLLPFIVLMVGKGAVSPKLFGLVSLTAFLYMQKNFPYYMLPVATVNKDVLSPLFHVAAPFGNVVQGALLPSSAGAVILAALGTLFSILILTMYLKGARAMALGESSGRTMLTHLGFSS